MAKFVDHGTALLPRRRRQLEPAKKPRKLRRANRMATIQTLQRIMAARGAVRLSDGRVGKIVRIDTVFPANTTTVTIWTDPNGDDSTGPDSRSPDSSNPGITKVPLSDIVGEAHRQTG
jgi:hypothetical protein